MEQKVIMAIDQGTTGTRVILFDHEGNATVTAYREIVQIYPQPGWVEHDAEKIWWGDFVKLCKNLCSRI